MMDCNQSWDVSEAIEWMHHLAEFKPTWIEEPTSPDDILGHAAIVKVQNNQLTNIHLSPRETSLFCPDIYLFKDCLNCTVPGSEPVGHWSSNRRALPKSSRLQTADAESVLQLLSDRRLSHWRHQRTYCRVSDGSEVQR